MRPFHYAFKVKDIDSTRQFYMNVLGCDEGRSTESWIDFDFFGNQLSAHVSDNIAPLDYCGHVDKVKVPIPHFGCLITNDQFNAVRERLEQAEVQFVIKPQVRYEGEVGEQSTMFVFDPSGNPLEFKSYTKEDEVFQK